MPASEIGPESPLTERLNRKDVKQARRLPILRVLRAFAVRSPGSPFRRHGKRPQRLNRKDAKYARLP